VKLLRGQQAQEGLGIKIMRNDKGEINILDVTPGGAAANAGVKVNDVIHTINGTTALGLTVRDAIPLMGGTGDVSLGLFRGPQRTDVKVAMPFPPSAHCEPFLAASDVA
jgi:C-terminal processing protease CtpA/Prc